LGVVQLTQGGGLLVCLLGVPRTHTRACSRLRTPHPAPPPLHTQAYWIDVKAKIRGNTTNTVEGILRDASTRSPPELVVLIFYDLPNRDCHAKASNGEICCTVRACVRACARACVCVRAYMRACVHE
jgi:hypothetical protein